MKSVTEVKHKWLWSVPEEMQVPAEYLASARRGRDAGLRVIFTEKSKGDTFHWLKLRYLS